MDGWEWGWASVQAMATAALALGLVFTLLQVYINRENARKSNTAEMGIEVLRDFRDEETKDTLRFIYQLSRQDIPRITSDEKHRIESLLDKFQLLGTLVKKDIIDRELAADLGPAAFRTWYKLHKYIREEREKRGFFYEQYEGYTEYCLEYFKETGFKVLFQKEGDGENVDLVKELDKPEIRPRSFAQIKQDAKAAKQR